MEAPDKIRRLLKDKQYFPAAKIIVKTLKTINEPEFVQIHALSDIRDTVGDHRQVC
jgi:hypothetical protein